jgi:hypothetical protein
MHNKLAKYLESIQVINEAERDYEEGSEPTEQMRLAYQQADVAWADIPFHIRDRLTPPPPLPGFGRLD